MIMFYYLDLDIYFYYKTMKYKILFSFEQLMNLSKVIVFLGVKSHIINTLLIKNY